MSDSHYDRVVAKRCLQRSIDYFDFWRNRTLIYWRNSEREPIYSQYPIPYRPGTQPEHLVAGQAADVPERGIHYFRDIYRTDEDVEGRTVHPSLGGHLDNIGFRMVKILGAGSQGLAVLFESKSNGDKFVFKWSKNVYSIATEMWCMRKMVGARHIVQRLYPREIDRMDASSHISEAYWNRCMADDIESRRELASFCGDPSLLIYAMEYMRHGNFNGLGRRLSGASIDTPVYLKDSELWRVFLCFFRSIVALAYPGQWDGGLNPVQQQPPTQEEYIPIVAGRPLSTLNGLIDFDINDRNVMLGEDTSTLRAGVDHAHDSVPVFKVGDLGYVGAFREMRYRTSLRAHVGWRVSGNPTCNPPEQFTTTWNNVSDWTSLAADDTAGKFDWWTNLWQIGRLMTILLTQCEARVPPDCVLHEVTVGDGSKKTIPTYAHPLVTDPTMSIYDQLLIDTLAWCMAHRPGDRPTLMELEQRIVTAVNKDWSNEDETNRRTIRQILSMPAPPRPPR